MSVAYTYMFYTFMEFTVCLKLKIFLNSFLKHFMFQSALKPINYERMKIFVVLEAILRHYETTPLRFFAQ